MYLQISGTAMGTRIAPQYANIFMSDLEHRFLDSQPLKPHMYIRFIDDIFLILTHGKELLEKFHQDFNAFHPTIEFTMDYSETEVNFLDTTVKIHDGHLHTTLYKKSTGRRTYWHASSFHPDHTLRSIVYSQALRCNRICSTTVERDKHHNYLHQVFTNLGYRSRIVNEQINRTKNIPRDQLLQYKQKNRH